MEFSKPVTKVIVSRHSKRDYRNEALSDGLLEKVQAILSENQKGFLGNCIEFKLIEKSSAITNYKVKLGTYGFISGARYFIAGGVDLSKSYILEDYGFLLEKIILQLTDLGLGTCWLGGTFNRADYSNFFDADQKLVVPAITPVGYPKPSKSIRENIIRWGAKSDSRKSWNELFFDQQFGQPLSESMAGVYQTPLEMLRLAPSASNKQPWRVVKNGSGFHFYLLETPGYDKTIKAVKLQRIDMGIAMSHFETTCKEMHINGSWQIQQPNIVSKHEQYLVSWILTQN
ncbi:MAG TPA: nitroreductase family protein [Prolixibacteraceae bacterium]|mgnify:CR=1 FL=1|nr:nitroreductase family protein [Prolixibacteraceae bacterium]